MKLTTWAATIGALLAGPLFAQTQQAPRSPDPADPQAAVAPIVYQSSIPGPTAAATEPASTPDKVWRAANDALAQSAGHGGHGAHHAPAAPKEATSAPPAKKSTHDHSQHH